MKYDIYKANKKINPKRLNIVMTTQLKPCMVADKSHSLNPLIIHNFCVLSL